MSKTLSAAPTRAPTAACQSGAPADQGEPPAPEQVTPEQARASTLPLPAAEAPRQPLARRRIASNLGEPAGMFVWERDFLLGLAADVLEGFVENHDCVENHHEEDE
jgi:hypothetical protein